MTSWLDNLDDNRPIRAVYGDQSPSLAAVTLHAVSLHRDGPRVVLVFDLPEFPVYPPKKWVQQEANVVQVELMLIGIRELSLRGWSTNPVVDLSVTRESSLVNVSASAGSVDIDIWSETAMVNRILAY